MTNDMPIAQPQRFYILYQLITYKMKSSIVITLVSLFLITTFTKVLVIMDNRNLIKTHTQFFKSLKENYGGIQFAYSFNKDKIELKQFGRFKYENIVVMCTSEKQIDSQIKVKDITNYFDEGGNVIIIGDIDTSRSFRKLFYSLGVDLDETGSLLKDNFNFHNRSDLIKTSNYEAVHPFVEIQHKLPLLYRGVGLNLVNYENYQLYNLVRAESTAFSRHIDNKMTTRAGTKITLVAGIQGLNNARSLISGSLDFFSNQIFDMPEYGNKKIVQDLTRWAFEKSGIIRFRDMHYHGLGSFNHETLFNVGEKIYYQVQAEQYNFETQSWEPYIADDIQVQFVMLDPWVRANLINKNGSSTYFAEFYAPQKEGIYQFKIIYKKPGYNFVTESQRVTVRPYKHDQFERFLFVAYPYFFGVFSTIIGTFIFLVAYLYTKQQKSKTQ